MPSIYDIQNEQYEGYTLRIYNDGTYDYICEALPGTATSEAKWRIYRIDNSGNLMYADGNGRFDNIADNYLLLTYE